MRSRGWGFFLIMLGVLLAINIFAQERVEEKAELKSTIFDITRLEKVKKETSNEFLADINERDIFSSPKFEVSQQVISPKNEVGLPELKIAYRGRLEIEGSKIALIEVTKGERKKSYFLKTGELVEGFRIVDIQRDFVILYSQEKGEKKVYFSSQ